MDIIELNEVNFDSEVKRSTQPVLVDFYGTWCGPCKKQLPVITEIAKKFAGKTRVAKLNIDDGQEKAMEFGINSVPTLLVFNEGRIVERMTGFQSENQLINILNKYN